MNIIIALLSLAFLALSTFFSEGSSRYFEVSPKAGIAPLEVTLNAEALKDSKKAETFIWEFGDGQKLTTSSPIIKHTFNTAGTFTVKLQYLKNKQDKIKNAKDGGQVKIVVSPKPNLLPIPQLSCVSNEVNKLECDSSGSTDSDGAIVSYKFDWGDNSTNDFTSVGIVSHQYQSAGEKTVRLTVTDNKGGSAFVEKSFLLKANTAPVANFSCTKTGIQKIHCESTSSDNEENISNFSWILDDGAVYNTASFDHTFTRPQDVAIAFHNVSLKVTDALGLENMIVKDVEVDLEVIREAPRGYFKAFIDGTTVDLRAFISRTQFNIKRATYQIYDTQNNLLHTLPVSNFYQNHSTKINLGSYGNYRVNFTIVDYRDQQVTITRQIPLVEDTTTLQPFVSFRAIQSNIRTLYLNLNLSFDYDENYSIREFVVNLGNGETKTLTTDTFLTYVYSQAGTYNVSVTAKTNHGTERTFSQQVVITDNAVDPVMPDPTFAYRIYSFAQNVSFYNEKSGTPNGEIISYHWDFGDNTTATGETQAHFYMPGEYLVKLTVVDTAGYSNTQTQKIVIAAEGDDIVANIDCNQRQPYLDITQMCKVNALDKFNEINRIRVVWGDGAVFTLATPFDPRQGVYYPQKAYTAEGTYAVRLIVNTARGAFKTHDISHTVTARRPVANIQCDVNNLLVNCHALGSFDPKGTPLSYEFNLGNGHTESNSTGMITYAYSDAGLYDVSVKVTDAQGLFSIATTKVQAIRPPNVLPFADFDCDSPEPHTLYCWEQGISDQDGFIVSKKLTFDDGDYGFLNSENPTRKQFTTSGQHEVTLTVIDNDGGVTAVTKNFSVKINNPPIANFECNSYGPHKLNCYSTTVDPDQWDYPVRFDWNFGDGNTQSGLSGWFDHQYASSQNVKVKLTVFDKYGGASAIEKEVKPLDDILPKVAINCYSNRPYEVDCYLNVSDQDGYVVEQKWFIDDVLTGFSGYQITKIFSESRDVLIRAEVKDDVGGISSASAAIHVKENQLPIANGHCTSDFAQGLSCFATGFDPDGIGDLTVEWEVDSKNFSSFIFSTTLESSGMKTVLLKVTDFHGGVSTQLIPILVKENLAPLSLASCEYSNESQIAICKSDSKDIDGNIVSTRWILGTGEVIEAQGFSRKLRLEEKLTYSLIVTDNLNKSSTFTGEVSNDSPILGSISSINDRCQIPESLTQHLCSEEYFEIETNQELEDYLSNGKFKDGKLLNLYISKNISLDKVDIKTTCDVRIGKDVTIRAHKEGVCIVGRNILIDSSDLVDESYKGIKILGEANALIKNSNITTEAELVIHNPNLDPFYNSIDVQESNLSAKFIMINSKSKLSIDSDTFMNASEVALSGGLCSVPDVANAGNCDDNPLPANAGIEVTSIENMNLNFHVQMDEIQTENTLWQINENPIFSENQDLKYRFDEIGMHYVKIAKITPNGFFRIYEKNFKVDQRNFYHGQIGAVHLFGHKNLPEIIEGVVGNENVKLVKTEENSEYYFIQFSEAMGSGLQNISIPLANFEGQVFLSALKSVSTPSLVIENHINQIELKLNEINSTDPAIQKSIESFRQSLDVWRSKIEKFSTEEKSQLASMLTFSAESYNSNTYFKLDQFLKDLIVPSAYAQSNLLYLPDAILPDILRNHVMYDYINQTVITGAFLLSGKALYALAKGGGSLELLGWVCKGPCLIGASIAFTGAGVGFMAAITKQVFALEEMNLPNKTTITAQINGEVRANEDATIKLRGQYIPLDSVTSTAPLIKSSIDKTRKDNETVKEANQIVNSINSVLDLISIGRVEEFPLIKYPQTRFPGFLSAKYVQGIKVLSSEDGSVKVSSFKALNNDLILKLSAKKSQSAEIEILYNNEDIGVTKKIKLQLAIKVDGPSAIINENANMRNVSFNSTDPSNQDLTGLTYIWDFGDGKTLTTESKIINHTYESIGNYLVKLKVEDQDGVYDVTEKTIEVSHSITMNIDPTGSYTFVDTQIGWKNDPTKDESIPDIKFPATEFDLSQFFNNPEIGLRAGDKIKIELSGYYDPGVASWQNDGDGWGAVAVFVGPTGFLNPGIGSTAWPIFTLPTCNQNFPTDIPQDFGLVQNGAVEVVIPDGATSIQFEVGDCFFSENQDPNGDLRVKITAIRGDR